MAAALFDLDGVIIDTEPSYSVFWGAMGEKYNVGIDDFANVIKGTTLTQILNRYFPDENLQREVVAQLMEYEKNMKYDIFPGVYDFLDQLKSAEVRCAIVTSSNLDKMSNLWTQHPDLREYFDVIVTDEDVTRSKPDPEPYLIAAKRLNQDIKDCVVFEDSINGVVSGRKAGALVVALDTTNPKQALIDKSDLVISSLTDISPEYLLKVLGHYD